MTLPTSQQLLQATEQYVQQQLQGHDESHSYSHIGRVRKMAVALAHLEGLDSSSLLVVELAALLHDISDHKYGGSNESARTLITDFLSSQGQPDTLISSVCEVVASVGFKEELSPGSSAKPLSKEAAVVQDADRLDAIGAVGIARCFTFGGAKHRVLYDPAVPPRLNLSKQEYMEGSSKATTINHFYEKLLKIKDLMKTDAGKQVAQQRHAFMEQYLQQFLAEWEGTA